MGDGWLYLSKESNGMSLYLEKSLKVIRLIQLAIKLIIGRGVALKYLIMRALMILFKLSLLLLYKHCTG